MTLRILHITPHLGGGVGTVLLRYLQAEARLRDREHAVVCLDYANPRAAAACQAMAVALRDRLAARPQAIAGAMGGADLVLVHWWNHPLLFAFLVREALPPVRLLLWSHISGLFPPNVFSPAVLAYPDLFVCTSPVSLAAPEVKALPDQARGRLRLVWSTGGVEYLAGLAPQPHEGFVVGYIGTVSPCKMHPDFLAISSLIDLPEVRFVVCGGPEEGLLRQQAEDRGLGHRFRILGPVDDVAAQLAGFDVFGYPLAPDHYGTCEQALGEAMAAGVPPVVLDNPAERQIVHHGVDGLVAAGGQAYAQAIADLCRRPDWRRQLGDEARRTAAERYSLPRMQEAWETIFREALAWPKRPRCWPGAVQGPAASPAQIYLESLGVHGNLFASTLAAASPGDRQTAWAAIRRLAAAPRWQAATRGTPAHYHSFFPEDPHLERWHRVLSGPGPALPGGHPRP
ncbi:MAG: glycosyltransferase family 4 protein [Thermodesulfobacteriota bacterium]